MTRSRSMEAQREVGTRFHAMNASEQLVFAECQTFDAEIDRQFELLIHQGKGPFPLCLEQKAILRILNRHRGQERALPLEQLCVETDLPRRRVEGYIASLVSDFLVRIGASRGKNHGYYLIRTAEELEKTSRIYENEIRSMARRVRVLKGKQFVAELLGQMKLELEAWGPFSIFDFEVQGNAMSLTSQSSDEMTLMLSRQPAEILQRARFHVLDSDGRGWADMFAWGILAAAQRGQAEDQLWRLGRAGL
jgi:hypothetical protein